MKVTFSDIDGVRYILDISESDLFFGSVLVGTSSASKTIEMTNEGWSDISLSHISLVGTGFSMEFSNPGILLPSQKVVATVTFDPNQAGIATGGIYVGTAEAGSAIVRLYGSGFLSANGNANVTGMPIFQLASELTSNEALNYENDTYVFVINDPVVANIGFYKKYGAAGAGSYDGPLSPYTTKISNASRDADDLGLIVNGAVDLNTVGIVPTRTGGNKKTVAKLEAEFQAKIDAQTVQEEVATTQATLAAGYAGDAADSAAYAATSATTATLTKQGLNVSFDVAKVSAASRVGGLYFDPTGGAYDWGIGFVGGVDVAVGFTFDTVAFWFQVAALTATVRYRLWRRPLAAAWMAQGPGDASDTQIGATQNIAVGTLGVIPDGPRAYVSFSVGATVTVEADYLYIHELEALDSGGNRLLSAIEYKSITGLTTDQYRKWRRAGGPTNSWSNQVTSTTFVYCYDLRIDGYMVKNMPEYYAPTVEAATAAVDGSVVTISADLSSGGAMADLSGSVTLDAATGGTVTDEALTLTVAGGSAKTYSYLTNRTVYADLANVVVKDASTLAVLVKDTNYWVIEELGCFSLPSTTGSPRNVLVSYTYNKMRYDLIHYTPSTGVIAATKGTERDRDQAEFIPATPTGAIPLFNIHVRRGGNIAVPVYDVVETIRRARWNEVQEEITRNRRLLRPVIKKLRAGSAVKIVAYGDSNLAQMGGGYSLAAIRSAANTIYHDRTKDTGGLLLAPAYGSDVLATIPTYDNADGAGSVHTRYGMVWELIRALEAAYSSAITYKNRSIPGANSSSSIYHGLDSTRLAAAVAGTGDAIVGPADFALIGFGQNDFGFSANTTRVNVIAICQAFQAVGTIPIVLGCYRPHARDLHTQHTTELWLRIQRELREAAYAVDCPHFSTLTFYADGENGALGLSPYDMSTGTKDVHPGIREHRIMGQRLPMSFYA